MDTILVGIIVAWALIFSIRSVIKTYKGQGGCNCSGGCTTKGKEGHCGQGQPFKIIHKK
ncbi:MAG: FeoB-associated Cys-rich membrane protein [Proteobacteria bacterium]|nr:FeoB-associated Cys-rich membrane protein [Desulfobacula sp.]MBU4130098.1 FeoB-associated Cys-rich membrane protein [Pseudomonadota bacterium]